jgi:hypothetical protein
MLASLEKNPQKIFSKLINIASTINYFEISKQPKNSQPISGQDKKQINE